MNSDEAFTSVKWDRDDSLEPREGFSETTIPEEASAKRSLIDDFGSDQEDRSSDPISHKSEASHKPDENVARDLEELRSTEPTQSKQNAIEDVEKDEDREGEQGEQETRKKDSPLDSSNFAPSVSEVAQAPTKNSLDYHFEEDHVSTQNWQTDEGELSISQNPEKSEEEIFEHKDPLESEPRNRANPLSSTSSNFHDEHDVSGSLTASKPNLNERDAFEGNSIQNEVISSSQPQQISSSVAQHQPEDQSKHRINDQQRMEDAFAKYFITSHVSNPISDRDGNSKPFISYLVTSETNHPEILRLSAAKGASNSPPPSSDKLTVKVRRRYGDFRFLHDCLVNDFPQLLVPPLPAKSNFKYLTGDTFSTAFVHKRLHSLDRFVTFICQHKILSQSSVFHYFINDSTEWASFTKNLKILKGEDNDGSIVGKVVNEDLLTETIMNFFTPSKHKKETNKDILEISEKLKKLYENLVKLDRIFAKLNKKNTDLKHDYESFSSQINKLAALHEADSQSENSGKDATTSFASSIENSQPGATSNFKIFSKSLLYFSENWAQLSRYIDESFLVSLKDCAKYIARLSSLIELLHNKKIDLQVLEDYLVKARNDFSNVGGSVSSTDSSHRAPPNPTLIGPSSGGIVNNTTQLIKDTLSTSATPHIASSQTEGKKHRLQQKIQSLEAEISAQTSLVDDLTNRIINEEYPNWDRFNKMQMKQSMADLCDQEISFYKGLVDNWTDVEAKLVQRLEELE